MSMTAIRAPLLSLLATAVVGTVLLLVTGHDPVVVGRVLAERTLLRRSGLEESLVSMAPILIAGLAAWIAARVGLWNIGIDGQAIVGAVVAGAIAPGLGALPAPLMWVTVSLVGMASGALWALLPAVLRARSGINEIVTTIMMTYVAFSLASWLIKGPLKDEALVAPATRSIDVSRRLPDLGDSRVHVGVLVAAGIALLAWGLARWSVPGILSRLVGEAPDAASTLHVPVSRYLIAGLMCSGAVAAFVGVLEVLAVRGSVQGDWRPSLTLPAFAALFLARRQPAWLIATSLLLGMLAYASTVAPRATGLAPDFFPMLEGILLIFLAIGEWYRRGLRADRARGGASGAGI